MIGVSRFLFTPELCDFYIFSALGVWPHIPSCYIQETRLLTHREVSSISVQKKKKKGTLISLIPDS